jgi:electron transport complex protein RnfG
MKITNMIKLGLVLAFFATAACVLLAFVYTGTFSIIEQRQKTDLEAALRDIFSDSDSFETAEGIKSPDASVTIENAYKAYRGGEAVGAALRLARAGYGGPVKLLAGISVDGTVCGVKIMEHSETPGLGANAASPSYFVDKARRITFYGQFAGKNVNDPFEVKGDVAAVTASTITSRAVTASVKAAAVAVSAWFSGLEADAVSGASEEEK